MGKRELGFCMCNFCLHQNCIEFLLESRAGGVSQYHYNYVGNFDLFLFSSTSLSPFVIVFA